MKAVVYVVACLAVVAVVAAAAVIKFEAQDTDLGDAYKFLQFLRKPSLPERYRPDSYFKKLGMNKNNRLQAFVWKSCEPAKDTTFDITQFNISPDPVSLPGTIIVRFSINNKAKIYSPFKAAVEIKKKVLSTWIEIPCIEQFGSCNYDDFCQILGMITSCPAPFTEHSIPCQCPIDVGTFNLPATNFEIDVTLPLESGDYFAMFNATANAKFSACYEFYFTIID
ncbi:ganglioside GM2 activator-like [Gigantopelta aegis]|uniref:ganglioside GM2 activator-like n=1 Tax=Gigantopelta aegis TaxID=1735272 RepID=UPI001B887624|nr:ganglioside GM2 activator-like [Gigantopelta aegis]